MPSLILASRSPQRSAILEQLGITFETLPSGVEELADGPAREVALENALRKARAVAVKAPGAELVLGADTVVVLAERLYGKPQDESEARATLRALSGRAHQVLTGVCVIAGGRERTAVAATSVRFRELSPELIEWYVSSGEWRERAGGYAVQGRGAALVAAIDGDYTNVVGLPVATLVDLLPGLFAAG